ncbi:MAG: VOC family protein [Flavisolibacter sp.]
MHPKKIWANYAVSDLERTNNFYIRLGFKFNGKSKDLVSFKFGDDEFIIHFFLKEVLESNTKVKYSDPQQGSEIIFTLSAETRDEVNTWAEEVKNAGGKIISAPEEFGEGYYGFVFADPDGHKFNVFHM